MLASGLTEGVESEVEKATRLQKCGRCGTAVAMVTLGTDPVPLGALLSGSYLFMLLKDFRFGGSRETLG